MFTVYKTDHFYAWLSGFKNPIAKKMVRMRLIRLENGNFGDYKHLKDGVYELRIHAHGGIRVYYTKQSNSIIILLCGGDKSNQDADIIKACELAKFYKEYNFEDQTD